MRVRISPFLLVLPLVGTAPRFAAAQTAAAQTDAVAASAPTPNHPVATAEAVQEAFIRVAEKLRPSVVTIECLTLPKPPSSAKPGDKTAPPSSDDDESPFNFADPTEPSSSLGTGMVIRADGYILTNNHVIKGADVIRVVFNAERENADRALAKLVGFDEESDLAVLKIARTDLPAVTFADSDAVRIGQWALAMGAPFDQPQTFTAGVVSAKGRHLDKKGAPGLQDYLQTDASINPGNSGGPLVDLDGQVIGINTAILSPSRFNVGIGFSAPSNSIKRLMPILIGGKSVQRGFLGIQYVRIDDSVAKEFGVPGGMQIGSLAKKKDGSYVGPAKDAGLREDDIITAVNGEQITSSDQFRTLVAVTPPGATLKFSVTRPGLDKGTQFETGVTLGDRAKLMDEAATPKPAVQIKAPLLGLGLEVANASGLSAADKSKYGGLTGREKGALIIKIAPASPADEADLLRGLRIVRARVGGVWQIVPDVAVWQKIEKAALPGAHLLLQVRGKDDMSLYKVIVVPEKELPATTLG